MSLVPNNVNFRRSYERRITGATNQQQVLSVDGVNDYQGLQTYRQSCGRRIFLSVCLSSPRFIGPNIRASRDSVTLVELALLETEKPQSATDSVWRCL